MCNRRYGHHTPVQLERCGLIGRVLSHQRTCRPARLECAGHPLRYGLFVDKLLKIIYLNRDSDHERAIAPTQIDGTKPICGSAASGGEFGETKPISGRFRIARSEIRPEVERSRWRNEANLGFGIDRRRNNSDWQKRSQFAAGSGAPVRRNPLRLWLPAFVELRQFASI
jgi:hypothetical protein